MKKCFCAVLALTLALLLCACGLAEEVKGGKTVTTDEKTAVETTSELPQTTEEDAVKTTAPDHSELYSPKYSLQQICEYFEEVVLDVEYTTGDGDASLVQKWDSPLLYRIYGSYTERDLEVLMNLFDELNGIRGFPGIYPAAVGEPENLNINFMNQGDFNALFSEILQGEDALGATQFWYYNDTNVIYTANVGYRTDVEQSRRDSILIEEIINMLGITDTVLREDSIVYQYSDDNLDLSDVDQIIVKLLYNPAIRPGMGIDECRATIGELYY